MRLLKHRTRRVAFKRQSLMPIAWETRFMTVSRKHDVCRNLIRSRLSKFKAGHVDEHNLAVDLLLQSEAPIAAIERFVGKLAREIEFSK